MVAADLLVRALEREGVEYVFGVPGEENLDVLEALRKSNIRLIVTRHEQSAGFMAATLGRLTGKPGVCLSTLGPGATNLVTAAAYAYLGGMPMLMVTGQKPIKKSKQGHFQIIDVVRMMEPITKFSKQVIHGDQIANVVRQAFRVAQEERPGPVHLEIPEDVAAEETSKGLLNVSMARRPVAEEKSIAAAVSLIEAAERPLVLVGAGANRKLTVNMLHSFIEKTGIPFFTTQMGKGVVDERHPLYVGTAALSDGDYVHCAIDQADLIINVGHDVIEKPPFIMKGERQVIHLNFFSADVDNVYFPQVEVVGDIANALWQLTERVGKQDSWDFSYFMKVKEKLEKVRERDSVSDRFPLIPQRVVADVRQVMPEAGIVTLDNGMFKLWFARNYVTYQPNTLLLDNALATMGAGLTSAIAAKVLYPDRRILAVCGDGGFMMNSQELETAVRLGLDLVVVVINDNAFGMISWKQQSMGFEDFGLSYGNPDFVKYAESYGAKGHRVSIDNHLKEIISKSFENGGVHLIEVPIDYSENKRVLTDELQNRNCEL